jgi:hypothetical protein
MPALNAAISATYFRLNIGLSLTANITQDSTWLAPPLSEITFETGQAADDIPPLD